MISRKCNPASSIGTVCGMMVFLILNGIFRQVQLKLMLHTKRDVLQLQASYNDADEGRNYDRQRNMRFGEKIRESPKIQETEVAAAW
jgi:hypothetical protein